MRANRQVETPLDLKITSLALISLSFLGILPTIPKANALILYSGSNTANTSAPDLAREAIFNSVAKVVNASNGNITSSAVYLRGKYLLTADHYFSVINREVTFDGTNYYAIDADFSPISIAQSDLSIFKLIEDPNLPDTELYTQVNGELNQNVTVIGWGKGRDPNQNNQTAYTRTWNWGDRSTTTKRWGTNTVRTIQYQNTFTNYNYQYHSLSITLDPSGGSNEAGIAQFDSGSGLFIYDSGQWKLAGIAALVSTEGSSTFGSSFTRDSNTYVQISQYWNSIQSQIPDTSTYPGWLIDNNLYGIDANYHSDTDGDGISQILEYAFQTNPHQAEPDRAPQYFIESTHSADYLNYSLVRPSLLNGVSYAVLTTTNLNDWQNAQSNISLVSSTQNADGTLTELYRRTSPIASSPQAYIRLLITLE
jgi:hypothetical protein